MSHDLEAQYCGTLYNGHVECERAELCRTIAQLRADNKALRDALKAREIADNAWLNDRTAHNVCHELTKHAQTLSRVAIAQAQKERE